MPRSVQDASYRQEYANIFNLGLGARILKALGAEDEVMQVNLAHVFKLKYPACDCPSMSPQGSFKRRTPLVLIAAYSQKLEAYEGSVGEFRSSKTSHYSVI